MLGIGNTRYRSRVVAGMARSIPEGQIRANSAPRLAFTKASKCRQGISDDSYPIPLNRRLPGEAYPRVSNPKHPPDRRLRTSERGRASRDEGVLRPTIRKIFRLIPTLCYFKDISQEPRLPIGQPMLPASSSRSSAMPGAVRFVVDWTAAAGLVERWFARLGAILASAADRLPDRVAVSCRNRVPRPIFPIM